MKGVFKLKGFNKKITHIFVVKEREDDEEMEMEIGCPMDVQHVGHIGWDGSAGDSAPSWMDEIKTGPEFASSSIGRSSMGVAAWSSAQEECTSTTTEEAGQKKHRRKKQKKSSTSTTTSPRNGGDETASKRRSKLKKGKAKLNELVASAS